MRLSMIVLLALAAIHIACLPLNRNRIAVLWTDQSEFAFYADYFNAAQDMYRIEVQYHRFPAQRLMENGANRNSPDIVVGNWLKSVSTRNFFRPLDNFMNKALQQNLFYPQLLDLGNTDGNQYLLPVSFNAPVVIFARERETALSNPFTIDFNEMQILGSNHNIQTSGMYTQMGFSPGWDDNFLFIIATLLDASFRETAPSLEIPIAWDSEALERAMNYAYEWTRGANSGIQAVDDFTFRYLYDSPAKLAISGRILFTFMNSDRFFTMTEDQRNSLGFRWIAEQDTIPIAEQKVYLGLTRRGSSRGSHRAAEAFLHWFFSTDTQRYILERNRQARMLETSFGISGGFSAMRTVTEQVFPQFYPELLGHMPPHDFLFPANILPGNWMLIKERVILPYLRDRARQPDNTEIHSLERRLEDWMRVNR